MKNSHEKFTDGLIISRLEQIELENLRPSLIGNTSFFAELSQIHLRPLSEDLPLALGLDLKLLGSSIIACKLKRSFMHQGLEQNLSLCSAHEALIEIAKCKLKAPIFYQCALVLALSKLYGEQIDDTTARNLCVAMEIARIEHHLGVIKDLLYCLKADSLAMLAAEISHSQKELFMRAARFYATDSALGLAIVNEILSESTILAEELLSAVLSEQSLQARLRKKANISLMLAGSLGLSGLYLRANHNYYDGRSLNASRIYQRAPRVQIAEGGHLWARLSLRLAEIIESLNWLKTTCSELKTTALLAPLTLLETPTPKPMALRQSFAEVESPEGDLKLSLFVDQNEQILYRLRSPAYYIAQAIPHMLLGQDLSDVPLILYSLGITAQEVDK